MRQAKTAEDRTSDLISTAQELLNTASGLNAEAKRVLRSENLYSLQDMRSLASALRTRRLRIQAFTEVHVEQIHDLGFQGLLDHLYRQAGSLGTLLAVTQNRIAEQ